MNAPRPNYPASSLIARVEWERFRTHKADGDMWPITWAADGNMYTAAGDNQDSPMNTWRIVDMPKFSGFSECWSVRLELLDNLPLDPAVYCQRPDVDKSRGIKPASLLSVKGLLYFAVELMNYGENPAFNRQRNVSAWIMTSSDNGQTWNKEATPVDFFTGRLSSPHFLQFGRDYQGARDEYVYAYFPVGDDGNSYWENGDAILLGRVDQDSILNRTAWEFYAGVGEDGKPSWSEEEEKAVPVFRYPSMTGENHVAYNPGLQRYLMGNYSFLDEQGNPRPYHQGPWPESAMRSQLTLFEAPEPWGPWSLFHIDDDWGTYGDYQPVFPTKWISEDGTDLVMVSSGSFDDYNFTMQRLKLILKRSE